jgi:hypothetical protein
MQQERAARYGAYSRRIGVAKKRVLRRERDVSDALASVSAVVGSDPALAVL